MYKEHFGMANTPFSRKIPPEMLFESSSIQEALARCIYVSKEQLFAVVTGDSGCGKSTLIRKLIEELPREEFITLYLSDSKLTPKWLYNGLIQQLGGTRKFYRGDAKCKAAKIVYLKPQGRGKLFLRHNKIGNHVMRHYAAFFIVLVAYILYHDIIMDV